VNRWSPQGELARRGHAEDGIAPQFEPFARSLPIVERDRMRRLQGRDRQAWSACTAERQRIRQLAPTTRTRAQRLHTVLQCRMTGLQPDTEFCG
jgi:hypothetical protein